MKAITYEKETDTFSSSALPRPTLETPHDVLVKVEYVGLNPVDAKINLWSAMVPDMDSTFVGGLDVSGEIVEFGSAVTGWSVGDKVLYHGDMRRAHGGFAQFAIHDSRSLTAHPAAAPHIAAATPCAGWTAHRALVSKLEIQRRRSLFIAGGSGGVGSFALQIARHYGLKTIITTCSAANADYVRSLGATVAVDYHSADPLDAIMELTHGEGVDVSLDCVGGDNDVLCASVLSYEGEMVELVKTCNLNNYPDAFMRGIGVHQLSLGSGHVNAERGRATIVVAGKEMNKLLDAGEITVPQLQVIALSDIPDALVAMRNQRTVGKIVAKVEH